MEFCIRWATKFFLSHRVSSLVFISFKSFFRLWLGRGGILKEESCYSLSQECWESPPRLPPGWCLKTQQWDASTNHQPMLFLMPITAVRRISSSCDRHCLVFIMKAEIKFFFYWCQEEQDLHLFQRCSVHLFSDTYVAAWGEGQVYFYSLVAFKRPETSFYIKPK